jgi:hypothetical protein
MTTINAFRQYLILFTTLLIVGCTSTETSVSEFLNKLPKVDLNTKSTNIIESTNTIDNSVETIREDQPGLVADIKLETSKIATVAETLNDDAETIEKMSEYITALECEIISNKKRIESLKEADNKFFKQLIYAIAVIAACMLVVGVILTAYGKSGIGIQMIIGSITLTSVAYGLAEYIMWIGAAGLILVFSALVYYVYRVVHHERALVEAVESVEIVKKHVGDWDTAKDILKKTQSNKTKQLIHDVKTNIINR